MTDTPDPSAETTTHSQPSLLALADAEEAAGRRCRAASLIATMSPEMQAEFYLMVESPKYTTSTIYRALTALGFKMSRSTLDLHIQKNCVCR